MDFKTKNNNYESSPPSCHVLTTIRKLHYFTLKPLFNRSLFILHDRKLCTGPMLSSLRASWPSPTRSFWRYEKVWSSALPEMFFLQWSVNAAQFIKWYLQPSFLIHEHTSWTNPRFQNHLFGIRFFSLCSFGSVLSNPINGSVGPDDQQAD